MCDFERWLGSLFGEDGVKVQELLGNQTALQFLIAWSLFESKCFDGFVKKEQLEKFSKCTAAKSDFPMKRLERAAHHFHERYQVREHRENRATRPGMCPVSKDTRRTDIGPVGPQRPFPLRVRGLSVSEQHLPRQQGRCLVAAV